MILCFNGLTRTMERLHSARVTGITTWDTLPTLLLTVGAHTVQSNWCHPRITGLSRTGHQGFQLLAWRVGYEITAIFSELYSVKSWKPPRMKILQQPRALLRYLTITERTSPSLGQLSIPKMYRFRKAHTSVLISSLLLGCFESL